MSLSGVDLNLLVALDALLAERNVTRAAERMSLGQPAMSAALARLRKQFGDPLLVREGRSYRLTTLAESLVDPVSAAIAAADQVLGVRRPFDPCTDERTFSVMASDYVTVVLLRSALVSTSQQVGGSVGTALPNTVAATATAGYLATRTDPQAALVQGYQAALLTGAAVLGLGAVVAAVLIRTGPARSR